MRAGRLEQAGPPGDVYACPANRFVAGFIGASNFLSGRLERHGTHMRVVTPGGLLLRVPEIAQACLGDGVAATVTIRPEAISLSAPGGGIDGEANASEMIIEQIVYRGFVNHYYLAAESGERLIAFRQNTGEASPATFAVGDRVRASWHVDSSHVMPNA
jgi:putative spermidine/putrescine transport system ATP-binding protein